jgi:hypothetical protein
VIDLPATCYAHTISLAQRLWAETLCQGLYWISRQDDRAPCVLLFGDRVPAARCLRAHGAIAASVTLMTQVYRAAAAGNIVLAAVD